MTTPRWEIIEDQTEDHWLEMFGYDGYGVFEDGALREIPTWFVVAKWDGCIHLYHYGNGYKTTPFAKYGHPAKYEYPGDDTEEEYFHLCELGGLDGLIATLSALLMKGREFYRDKSGSANDPWDDRSPEERERERASLETTFRLLQAGLEPPSTPYWTNTRSE